MTDSVKKELIEALSRHVVSEIASHELPLFPATSEAFFQNPEGVQKSKKGLEERLGFGESNIVIFLTPVVMAVASKVVEYILNKVGEIIGERSLTLSERMLRRLFWLDSTAEEESQQILTLAPEQIARIHKLSLEKALHLGLSEQQARMLADSMVGGLTMNHEGHTSSS